ncbi:MAG: cellulase family glycosylhydrolase [Bacteroidales bacterium]|nr:cellulase family glycosylhydrolase [Bacteroidales bacterium]
MKRRVLVLLSTLVLMVVCISAQESPGFKVVGRHLYDKCGERVILRGVANPNIWFEKSGIPRYAEIKQTGANVVRIVWQTWGTAAELDVAISNCIAEDMIPMIELHDATGDWSKLQLCVDYWVREDIVDVIQKHEEYLLLNIANECGNNVSSTSFLNGYTAVVQQMRDSSIHVPLVIDASGWGQNINILQSQGPTLIENDPDHNLLFSVHMWWPPMYGYTESDIVDEIAQSVAMGLPLIVGEFSQMHGDCDETQITVSNSIAYKTIIRECQENNVGYIAWSWWGNCNYRWDMSSSGTYSTLYDWGLEVAVTDANSIKNTSVRPYSILHGECNPNPVNSINQVDQLVETCTLFPNYLDAAHVYATLQYTLTQSSQVTVKVYNSLGTEIQTLVNSGQTPGEYSVRFNAEGLPGGMYFCVVKTGQFNKSFKLILH